MCVEFVVGSVLAPTGFSPGTLGHFPFSQNFQFNRLKCKWNAQIEWKLPGTDG